MQLAALRRSVLYLKLHGALGLWWPFEQMMEAFDASVRAEDDPRSCVSFRDGSVYQQDQSSARHLPKAAPTQPPNHAQSKPGRKQAAHGAYLPRVAQLFAQACTLRGGSEGGVLEDDAAATSHGAVLIQC